MLIFHLFSRRWNSKRPPDRLLAVTHTPPTPPAEIKRSISCPNTFSSAINISNLLALKLFAVIFDAID